MRFARMLSSALRVTPATALRLSALLTLSVTSFGLYACAGGTTSGTPCVFTPDDTPKADPQTVFRAKSIPCFIDNDCRATTITPRCSAPELARCDKTQKSTKLGICVFQLTGLGTTCNTCYEGDIRYCDVGDAGGCSQTNRASCGIQTCAKDDDGGIPPGTAWKSCIPMSQLNH